MYTSNEKYFEVLRSTLTERTSTVQQDFFFETEPYEKRFCVHFEKTKKVMMRRPRLAVITALRRRLRLSLSLLFLGCCLCALLLLPALVRRAATYTKPLTSNGVSLSTIPMGVADPGTPYKPFLDHHMTRYAKGCVDPLLVVGDLKRAGHQSVVPIVHEFDHMYAPCGLRWLRPKGASVQVCMYSQPNATAVPPHRVNQSSGSRTLRVHVSSEGPKPLAHFLAHALPSYEAQVCTSLGKGQTALW